MTFSDALALTALVVSWVALLLTTWQVVRGEQALDHRAWSVLRLDHGSVSPGRRGVEVEFSIVGRAVLHQVTPFIHGGMTIRAMSDPVARLDCTAEPVRFVVDIRADAGEDADSWVGVTWLSAKRFGRVRVEDALRVHLPSGKVEHWLWPLGYAWRRRPRGRWGVRRVRIGRARYDVPGLEASYAREQQRLERSRAVSAWPLRVS